MKLSELENEARQELESEKVDIAKGVIKERIREIEKTEAILKKLKAKYAEMLEKSVEDIIDGETGGITF